MFLHRLGSAFPFVRRLLKPGNGGSGGGGGGGGSSGAMVRGNIGGGGGGGGGDGSARMLKKGPFESLLCQLGTAEFTAKLNDVTKQAQDWWVRVKLFLADNILY